MANAPPTQTPWWVLVIFFAGCILALWGFGTLFFEFAWPKLKKGAIETARGLEKRLYFAEMIGYGFSFVLLISGLPFVLQRIPLGPSGTISLLGTSVSQTDVGVLLIVLSIIVFIFTMKTHHG